MAKCAFNRISATIRIFSETKTQAIKQWNCEHIIKTKMLQLQCSGRCWRVAAKEKLALSNEAHDSYLKHDKFYVYSTNFNYRFSSTSRNERDLWPLIDLISFMSSYHPSNAAKIDEVCSFGLFFPQNFLRFLRADELWKEIEHVFSLSLVRAALITLHSRRCHKFFLVMK